MTGIGKNKKKVKTFAQSTKRPAGTTQKVGDQESTVQEADSPPPPPPTNYEEKQKRNLNAMGHTTQLHSMASSLLGPIYCKAYKASCIASSVATVDK